MQFYCYVYYDENWQAYYVGKGQGGRMYTPQRHPDLPPEDRIQVFHFEQEWQAWECEIELIAFWGRYCDGGTLLNQSIGGKGGATGVKRSQQTKIKMSKAMKGKQNFLGRKHTQATKDKLSNSKKGFKHSKEAKDKMSASSLGKIHSIQTKEKIAAAGRGRKHSEETKAKMRAAWVIRKQKQQEAS